MDLVSDRICPASNIVVPQQHISDVRLLINKQELVISGVHFQNDLAHIELTDDGYFGIDIFQCQDFEKLGIAYSIYLAGFRLNKEGYELSHIHVRFDDQGEIMRTEVREDYETPVITNVMRSYVEGDTNAVTKFFKLQLEAFCIPSWENQITNGKTYLLNNLLENKL